MTFRVESDITVPPACWLQQQCDYVNNTCDALILNFHRRNFKSQYKLQTTARNWETSRRVFCSAP